MIPGVKNILLQLETDMLAATKLYQHQLGLIHPAFRNSAENLLHYLTLRKNDLRPVQEALHNLGLSSLTNSESHTLFQIRAVLQWLRGAGEECDTAIIDPDTAKNKIQEQSTGLFGQKEEEEANAWLPDQLPFIMVTLDSAGADDMDQMCRFLEEGMNVARINCAHDDEETWAKMIKTLRKAMATTGKPCRIYMDLAGPKLRTGLPGKGNEKGKIHLKEGQNVLLVEPDFKATEKQRAISCSIGGIVTQLKPGQKVLFDDGLISTVVEKVGKSGAMLRVERVSGKRPYLKSFKGINFPDANLTIESLTTDDRKALPFICREANMVGYSFVRTLDDLKALQEALDKLSTKPPSIIIKVETPEAFRNLPHLLLQGMMKPSLGVMIARGDLAVEVGFERMSELQEEILWICEAAHVPVIWATQVLENLNKTGVATRSEATDAARSFMAECVMINKGTHTVEVIRMLKDILRRSGGHRIKRRHIFRPLAVADNFFSNTPHQALP